MSIDPTHPLSSEDFEYIYSRVPRLCVDLVVKTPAGIVLTLRKLPSWQGCWHTPGGAVLYGETIQQAIQRVARTEIGVEVEIEKLLGYMEFPSERKERGFGWSISMFFLCRATSENFILNNDDASEIKVFPQLPEKMIEEQRVFLESHGVLVDNIALPQ